MIRTWFTCMRSIHTGGHPLQISASPILWAEPLKKKRRIDPAVVRAREEKRMKKLEKAIRRREKAAKPLKPLQEMEVSPKMMQMKSRDVKENPQKAAEEVQMLKEWSSYRYQENLKDMQMIDRVMASQEKALRELRLESEQLYQAAIQIDETLVPYTAKGPLRTPPIAGYKSPDGEYIDTTKTFTEHQKDFFTDDQKRLLKKIKTR